MRQTDVNASPDPSGIGHWSSRGSLLISDGEVDEIPSPNPGAYQGANLFETTLDGSLVRTSSTTGADPNDSNDTSPPLNPTNYSNEPVGVAFNAENGFVSSRTTIRTRYS
jgi:hypothetical protein